MPIIHAPAPEAAGVLLRIVSARRAARLAAVLAGILVACILAPLPAHAQALPPPGSDRDAGAASATGQQPPPTASDELFVVTAGGDMDEYLYREDVAGGRLRFQLPIGRYFSPLITPAAVDSSGVLKSATAQQLIDHHILPATVTLSLSAYDVDEDGAPCPEVDHIYVNGRQVLQNGAAAKLSGANNTWSVPSFQIPLAYLKLPTAPGISDRPPTAAQNEIAVDINTLQCVPPGSYSGSSWAVEIDWASIRIPGAVHPILFAHGWTGDTHAFDSFVGYAKADGIPTAGQADLYAGILPVETTATLLTVAIDRALREYGVDQVNLFAHSKGGIVARAATANARVAAEVDRLITFSSPHHGSAFMDTTALAKCNLNYPVDVAGYYLCRAAAHELGIDVMRSFNYKSCRQVFEFKFWAPRWEGCLANPVAVKHAGITYATFVGDAVLEIDPTSATLPWNGGVPPYPTAANVDGVYADYDHGATKDRIESYRCAISYIDPAIHSNASCPAALAATGTTGAEEMPSPAAAAAAAPEEQLVAFFAGDLPAGAPTNHSASVDTVQQLFVTAYSQQPLAAFTLQAPDGTVLTSSSPNVSYATGKLESTFVQRFAVAAAAPGTWKVQLTGGQATRYVVDLRVASAVNLEMAAAKESYKVNETVTLYAALVQDDTTPLPAATIEAALAHAGGTETPLSLHDDGLNGDVTAGDGIFSGQFAAPSTGGYQLITGRATYGGSVRRSEAWVAVAPDSAKLGTVVAERALDTNGNGLYDVLEIDVQLNVLQAGNYELNGDLVDGAGGTVAVAAVSTLRDNLGSLQPGTRVLTLRFDGRTIRRHAADGPFSLAAVLLKDQTAGAFTVDTAANLYQTRTYRYTEFEAVALQFVAGSEEVLDQDNDDVPDALQLVLTFTILVPGTYEVNGRLVDGNGNEVGWVQTSFRAPAAGEYAIALTFQGGALLRTGAPGPYTLRDVSIFSQAAGQSQVYALLYTTTLMYPVGYFEQPDIRVYLPNIRHGVPVVAPVCSKGAFTPVDVMFALDRSESFAVQNRIGRSKVAIIAFMDKINGTGEQVGLTKFNKVVELSQPLTTDKQAVFNLLVNVPAGEGTAIGDAIKVAADELLGPRHIPGRRPVLIIFSDGENTDGSDPMKQAAAAKARGIRIFTVSSWENVDKDLLRKLASAAGDFYYTAGTHDMADSARIIADRVRCGD